MSLECPQGFVIPDDPTSQANIYIDKNISECVLSCLNPPLFTERDITMFDSTEMYSSIAGAAFSFIVVILWSLNEIKRKRFFVIAYGTGVICALIFMAISSSFGRARLCRNNANSIDGSEGISLCAMEAAILIFAVTSCSAFFCIQSFEIFRKLVLSSKVPTWSWLYSLIVLGIPLVCAIAGLAAGILGADIGTPICRNTHHAPVALLLSVIPVAVFTFFGLIFSISITVKTFWLVTVGNSVWDTLRLASTPLHFIVFTGLYLVALFSLRFYVLNDASVFARQQVMLDWGACALAHFDGTAESYVASCGAHPDHKISIVIWCLSAFSIRGGFGFCFFMVNIHGVLAELGKYFCPSYVQPAPYVELTPVSLNSSAEISATCVSITAAMPPVDQALAIDRYGGLSIASSYGYRESSNSISEGAFADMARANACAEDLAIINEVCDAAV